MRLFNNDFKAAMKAYKAVKTICKSAKFCINCDEALIQANDVEVSYLIEPDKLGNDEFLIDDTTLKIMEKVKDTFEIFENEVKSDTKVISYNCNEIKNELIGYETFKEVATISQAELLERLKSIKFATAKDDVRPVLQNILWDTDKFVAVDGYRICTKNLSVSAEMPVLITPTAFGLLEKLLDKKSKDTVKVFLDLDHTDKRYIAFEFGDYCVITLVGIGEFLKYKQVFTDDCELKVEVNRKDLIEKLEFVQQDKIPVKFSIGEDFIVECETTTNKLKDTVKFEVVAGADKSLVIAFNPKFLIESLKNGVGEHVTLNFIASLTPLILNYEDGKDLVLPIRLNK